MSMRTIGGYVGRACGHAVWRHEDAVAVDVEADGRVS